jgi:hypothetical protein
LHPKDEEFPPATHGKVWNGYKWEDKNPVEVGEPETPEDKNPVEVGEPETPEAVVPFDRRTEVSADAYHIVKRAREDSREAAGRIIKHLWIIFVLLPVVLGILFAILTAK